MTIERLEKYKLNDRVGRRLRTSRRQQELRGSVKIKGGIVTGLLEQGVGGEKGRKRRMETGEKENFLSRYRLRMLRAQSQPGHRLLFAVAGESHGEAENGKLFKRASTQ